MTSNQGKEISFEDHAQNQKNQEPTDSKMHPPDPPASTSLVPTIFQVIASATRRPPHAAPHANSLSHKL
jgi:hypothetical protein